MMELYVWDETVSSKSEAVNVRFFWPSGSTFPQLKYGDAIIVHSSPLKEFNRKKQTIVKKNFFFVNSEQFQRGERKNNSTFTTNNGITLYESQNKLLRELFVWLEEAGSLQVLRSEREYNVRLTDLGERTVDICAKVSFLHSEFCSVV